MTSPSADVHTQADASSGETPSTYSGEVVYFFAFDIAYEMQRAPITTLLGQPVSEFSLDTNKRAPRQHTFYRPSTVKLPAMERPGPDGPLRLERTVKLLPVGAVSITVRIAFADRTLGGLTSFHDLRFGDGAYLYEEVRRIAADVRQELMPILIRPMDDLREEEAYTVFCIRTPAREPAFCCQDWLVRNRRQVAALLTEEPEQSELSAQESEESTSKWLSYYERDLVVIDWDAALLIDEPRYFDETLYVIELANIQLAEFEAYDRLLDSVVERSYRDISAKRWNTLRAIGIPRDLRELRIDLARLSDELLNTTKFFGDWHMARLYEALSDRFHLEDWHRSIDDKLKTLDDLYQLLRSEQNNRWMLILEATIVALFIIDLVAIFMMPK